MRVFLNRVPVFASLVWNTSILTQSAKHLCWVAVFSRGGLPMKKTSEGDFEMIEKIPDLPDNFLGFVAKGTITAMDI